VWGVGAVLQTFHQALTDDCNRYLESNRLTWLSGGLLQELTNLQEL
jgi:hypothetical protein